MPKPFLPSERTLLNLLSRMSGIATTTHRLTEKLAKSRLENKNCCNTQISARTALL